MNKYKEALRNLVKGSCPEKVYCDECNFSCLCNKEAKEWIDSLRELVEKATPKKPTGTYTDYKCPVCGRRVRSGKGSSSFTRDNVCQRCFQVLDWEEEE